MSCIDVYKSTTELKSYSAAGGQILFGTDVGYTDAFDTTEEYRLMSAAPSDGRCRRKHSVESRVRRRGAYHGISLTVAFRMADERLVAIDARTATI